MNHSSQSSMPGAPHGAPVPSNSLPPEYWGHLDSLHQSNQPPQMQQVRQQAQQQVPSGIGWDHPIFNQQQSHGPRQVDHAHGIYTPDGQSWNQNPLHQQMMPQPPQGYDMGRQYQPIQPYPESHSPFDVRHVPQPENSPFPQYSYPQNHYPPQRFSMPSQPTMDQSVHSQTPQPGFYQSGTPQPQGAQYAVPAGQASHTPIDLTNGYQNPNAGMPVQSTINPQFLNTPQQSVDGPADDNFLYVRPADFERSRNSGKTLSAYPHGVQVSPAPNQAGHNMSFEQMQHVFRPQPPTQVNQVSKSQPGTKKQQPLVKNPTGKTARRQASATLSPGSSSESTEDSDLEIQDDEPSPIPATRPGEPLAAAEYDTLQAVWFPRNRRVPSDKVKNALVAFKDLVKAIRDVWKERTQAMNAAENKGESDEATRIKTDVVLQRRLINAVISTTLDKGHPKIVEKLGEHPMAVSVMYSFLVDRHQASDLDGELTINVLKLLSHFVTMEDDVLQKTNVAKMLVRLQKKGGQTVQTLSQKILNNAAAATKRRESAKSSSKENSPIKSPALSSAIPEKDRTELAGSKRPRDAENIVSNSKRMLVGSQAKNGAAKPAAATAPGKRPQENGQDAKGTAMASRPKANIIAPKPTNLFGSLQTASKRPGTSNAERAAAAAKGSTGENEKKENRQPPKPAFSFGDVMNDLKKQNDTPPPEPTEERPPETEEERAKRLRKESRKKLRVSWKPDSSLTEVRYFTHAPEEELGPGDRAAGDVKGEGKILKLHKDLEELSDEDDGGVKEETIRAYHIPGDIDFGNASPGNFVKRAGNEQPTSPEKQAQEHREATTLMVYYTSPADVPSSPKEPPQPDSEEPESTMQSFGDLPDHIKARQDRHYAAVQRKATPPSQQNPQNNMSNVTDFLKAMAPQQQAPTPPPQHMSQEPMGDVERAISMFQQQQQQLQMQQFPQFAPQMSGAPGVDIRQILETINNQKQPQQPTPFQQPVQPPSIPANLASIVSQFKGSQPSGGGQYQQPSPFHEDPERKRMRETGGYDDSYDDRFNAAKRKKQPGLGKHPKAGLVPCRYWAEGRCVKGTECTFRHDPLD